MDNYFQNIYRPVLRTAEKTDTRAAITRHQQQQEKSKERDKKPESSGNIFGDDVMSVSLDALAGLLEDLLVKSNEHGNDEPDSQDDNENEEEDPERKAAKSSEPSVAPSRQSRFATSAYQHAAETRSDEAPSHSIEKPHSDEHFGGEAVIPAADIDTQRVKNLLDKTRELKSRGYDHIEIEDRGNFLVSIEQTIAHYLEAQS